MGGIVIATSEQVEKQQNVDGLVSTRFVRLPGWFTLAQALRVAELRGVNHVLVEDQGRVRGAVDRQTLTRGRPLDSLARWMNRSEAFVEPSLSVAEARAIMESGGLTCLPVARGGILIGTLDAEALQGSDCERRESEVLAA